MLFGRAPPREEVDISELDKYLNVCLDEKLRRLSARAPEIERGLSNGLSSFESSIRRFSASGGAPDMEYLYGIKEGNVIAQKPSYTASLIRIASARPEFGGVNIYYKSESMLNAYNALMHEILKANNTFRLVMVAYVHGLSDVKRHFNTMERLCKDLSNELDACSQQIGEYKELHNKIGFVKDSMSKVSIMRRSMHEYASPGSLDDGIGGDIAGRIKSKEEELELQRRDYNGKKSALTGLLLPVERAARKHDHMSQSKRRLADYIREPMERLRNDDDVKELNRHIASMVEEINSGKIEVKNADGFISMLNRIRNTDFLSIRASLEAQKDRVKVTEGGLAGLHAELQRLDRQRDEQRRTIEEKGKAEYAINSHLNAISNEKGKIERLFLDYYKRHVEISIDTDAL